MESRSAGYSAESANSSVVAETLESCSPDGGGAARGCQTPLPKDKNLTSTDVAIEEARGVAGGAIFDKKEEAEPSDGEAHKFGRASKGEVVETHVSLSRHHSVSTPENLSSAGKTEFTHTSVTDPPVVVGENVDYSKAAEEERAEETCVPAAAPSSSDNRVKKRNAEKLRFRSTLATFINDSKGIYGEWRAKEEAATAAAKELLQMLAERVENLLNDATVVARRLTQRKEALHEEEIQRRASSKKVSSSPLPPYEQGFACLDDIEERGRGKDTRTKNHSDHEGRSEMQMFRSVAGGKSDIGAAKKAAVEAVERLLKIALKHKRDASESRTHEGRKKGDKECERLETTNSPVSGQGQEESSTEEHYYSFEKPHLQSASRFSRSSLDGYDTKNFPEDILTCRPQESRIVPPNIPKEVVETSACEPKASVDPLLKRDKLWKIFGRETQAGRLLYQLYKTAEPGGDIVYPIPKSIKDLRGNPNFQVLARESSSSLAAAAGRHPKRRQVKVAVPRVGRHTARAAKAAGNGSSNRKFEKGNFLYDRGPGAKRSLKQIEKETESRRQQILDEASAHGVAAAAVGLKRDREKALLLQKLPYSACSLLPEAARLPPLSPRDRTVFFTEKVMADRASLYSARSPSPSPPGKNGSNNETSSNSSSKRSSSTHTNMYCSSRPCRGSKWEASVRKGIVDPCVQTLIPYVAAAKQRYRKQGVIDPKTGMTEEQKQLFVQTLREIQLRRRKLENLQKSLPDHVLAASFGPVEPCPPVSNPAGDGNSNDGGYSGGKRPPTSSRGNSRPESGVETTSKEVNLFTTYCSPDVAKSRLAQRTILQQLQDETKLKREIRERMKELETLISISDAQQRELQQKGQEEIQSPQC